MATSFTNLKDALTPLPLKHACGMPHHSYYRTSSGGPTKAALMSENVLDFVSTRVTRESKYRLMITYSFIQDQFYSAGRKDVVEKTIKQGRIANLETWEDYANIEFKFTTDTAGADIRVAFQPGSSWSAVGKAAKNIEPDRPTLNLGWISEGPTPTPGDCGIVLHEFGHALGLMHEHQSPARGQYIHLDEVEVYNYYTPLLGTREKVKSQIIDVYNKGAILNMSKFDTKSIMMYFMPAHLNLERLEIPVNTELSKLDKALIQLNYPPNLTSSGDMTKLNKFIKAMIDVGITNQAAGGILDAFVTGDQTRPHDCYAEARARFSTYNQVAMKLRQANSKLLNTIDRADLTQFGVVDFLGSIVNNKLFQSILKTVVQNTLVQEGIPVTNLIPAASPVMVKRMMGGLSAHPQVGGYVQSYLTAQGVARRKPAA